MSNIKDTTVLITGGASGIGKLMGEMCLEQGARQLIIWDIDENKTVALVTSLRSQGYEVHYNILDLEKTEAIIKGAKEVLEKFGAIDLLFNNAGVVIGKDFTMHTHRDIDFTTNINVNALMHVTLEFLPVMISRKKGHIINIASAAGLMAVPKMAVYVASKHAVLGWSESLRLELETVSKNLHVTTVTPSFISTGMFEGVRSPVIPLVTPEKAAKKIIKGVKRNKRYVRMPGIVYLVPFIKGVLPQRWFDVVAGKWFGFYKSMNTFRGRS
ncbi:MAG: SDR family NAD(P)-dependent oxidoreductase [Chitinophagaceae bacterium]|nr:SDR family NAD(P)-dependent oxidoreductase [Chitinophagaceae bacterium]